MSVKTNTQIPIPVNFCHLNMTTEISTSLIWFVRLLSVWHVCLLSQKPPNNGRIVQDMTWDHYCPYHPEAPDIFESWYGFLKILLKRTSSPSLLTSFYSIQLSNVQFYFISCCCPRRRSLPSGNDRMKEGGDYIDYFENSGFPPGYY